MSAVVKPAVEEQRESVGGQFKPEVLELRRKSLGASEIAAVVGIHPYGRSALDVWLEKRGVVQAFAGNENTEWGLRLEEVIAAKYADVHGVTLMPAHAHYHPSESWMSATPDRLALSAPEISDFCRGLELKNRNAHDAHKFGESGSDEVPVDIAAQCHWSMLVTGLTTWDVAVLIGGNRFRWFRLAYDAEIAASLQEMGHTFWHKHVLAGVEPAIDHTESWTRYIKQKFQGHTDHLRDATAEETEIVVKLRKTRDMRKKYEEEETLFENMLKNAIGDSAGILSPAGTITWKRTKDTVGPDNGAIAVELLSRLSEEERAAIINKHTRVLREGSRRFLPSFPRT